VIPDAYAFGAALKLLEAFNTLVAGNGEDPEDHEPNLSGFLSFNVLMEIYHDFSGHDKVRGFLNTGGDPWGNGRQPYKEQALISLFYLVVKADNRSHPVLDGLAGLFADTTLGNRELLADAKVVCDDVKAAPDMPADAKDGPDAVWTIVEQFLGKEGQYYSANHAAQDKAGLFLVLNQIHWGSHEEKDFKDAKAYYKDYFRNVAEKLQLEPLSLLDGSERAFMACVIDIVPPLQTLIREGEEEAAAAPASAAPASAAPASASASAAGPGDNYPLNYILDPTLVSKFDPGVGHSTGRLTRGQVRARQTSEDDQQCLHFRSPMPRTQTIMTSKGGFNADYPRKISEKADIAIFSINDGRLLATHTIDPDEFDTGPNPNEIQQVMQKIREEFAVGGDDMSFNPAKCVGVDGDPEEASAKYLIHYRRKALGDSCQSDLCEMLMMRGADLGLALSSNWSGVRHGVTNPISVVPYEAGPFDGTPVQPVTGPSSDAFLPVCCSTKTGGVAEVKFSDLSEDSFATIYLTKDLLSGALGALRSCSTTCVNTESLAAEAEPASGQVSKRRKLSMIAGLPSLLGKFVGAVNACSPAMGDRLLRGIDILYGRGGGQGGGGTVAGVANITVIPPTGSRPGVVQVLGDSKVNTWSVGPQKGGWTPEQRLILVKFLVGLDAMESSAYEALAEIGRLLNMPVGRGEQCDNEIRSRVEVIKGHAEYVESILGSIGIEYDGRETDLVALTGAMATGASGAESGEAGAAEMAVASVTNEKSEHDLGAGIGHSDEIKSSPGSDSGSAEDSGPSVVTSELNTGTGTGSLVGSDTGTAEDSRSSVDTSESGLGTGTGSRAGSDSESDSGSDKAERKPGYLSEATSEGGGSSRTKKRQRSKPRARFSRKKKQSKKREKLTRRKRRPRKKRTTRRRN
jgi:hypothetical protein